MCSSAKGHLQVNKTPASPTAPPTKAQSPCHNYPSEASKTVPATWRQQEKQSPSYSQLRPPFRSTQQQKRHNADASPSPLIKVCPPKKSCLLASLDEPETIETMSSSMSRNSSQSSKKSSTPPPAKRAKTATSNRSKDMDWADVTDPEERRRIQNRIAQRKFREKARENKEKAERDSRNRDNAGNSYRIPSPADVGATEDLSGLPWGSMNLSHVLSRGHEFESRRSSGRGTYAGDDNYHTSSNFCLATSYTPAILQAPSYGGSSAGEEAIYDDKPYMYPAATPIPAFSVQ